MTIAALRQRMKYAFGRVAPEQNSVRVDRDQLRTILLQCEFEVRDMRRMMYLKAAPASHRRAVPSCRY